MNPQSHSDRGTHFQCKQYSPLSVYDKHCKFYRNGNCNKTGERCVEWLRRNPSNPPKPVDVDLFGNPVSDIDKHSIRSSEKKPSPVPSRPLSSTKTKPLTGFTKELIESFKRLQTEIHFTSDTGQFWLVPEYRVPSRGEITPEHLALICQALMAFPGATVTAFETISPKKEENSHE